MAAPWMPLYIADYIADTGHLQASEHGGYLLLIMHYWRHRGLPADEVHLQRIARMTPAEWRRSRDTLAGLFQEGWTHKRIDAELLKSDEKSTRRAESGSRGGRAKADNAKALKTKKPPLAKATILLEQKDSDALASSSQSQSYTERVSLRETMARMPVGEAFAVWYAAYPHKVDRPAAEKAFNRIASADLVALDTLTAGVAEYKRSKPPDRAWRNPATWLNGEGWKDKPGVAPTINGARASPSRLTKNPFMQSLLDDADDHNADNHRQEPQRGYLTIEH